jgi:TonB family protein
MSLLIESTVRVSSVLVLALVAAAVLRMRSAALRHWILAAAIAAAVAMPMLRPIAPSWNLPLDLATAQGPPAPQQLPRAGPRSRDGAPAAAAPTGLAPRRPIDVDRLTGFAWAAGAAVSVLLLIAGFVRVSALVSHADRLVDGPAVQLSHELAGAIGLKRSIRLLESDQPSLPITWGIRHPIILLPRSAREWPADRLRLVLLHELTHVQRADWATQLTAELVRSIYWFNPLVWIAARRLRHESEVACDDGVLNGGVDGAEYAAHLLALARTATARGRGFLGGFPAPAMARPSSLERRFRAMLNVRLNRSPATRPARVAATIAVFLVSVLIAGLGVAQTFSTFSGSVVDSTNRILPGVTLTLVNTQSQAKYQIKSDSAGRFEFVGLPPGDYSWSTQLNGFATLRGTLAVSGRDVQQDLALRVGALEETITIKGGSSTSTAPRQVDVSEPAPRAARAPCTAGPVGGTIKPPRKIRNVDPQYPADLNAARIGGVVILDVAVDASGGVQDVSVLRSPNPGLELAATEAVRQWKFTPTLLNCVPVDMRINVTAAFVP